MSKKKTRGKKKNEQKQSHRLPSYCLPRVLPRAETPSETARAQQNTVEAAAAPISAEAADVATPSPTVDFTTGQSVSHGKSSKRKKNASVKKAEKRSATAGAAAVLATATQVGAAATAPATKPAAETPAPSQPVEGQPQPPESAQAEDEDAEAEANSIWVTFGYAAAIVILVVVAGMQLWSLFSNRQTELRNIAGEGKKVGKHRPRLLHGVDPRAVRGTALAYDFLQLQKDPALKLSDEQITQIKPHLLKLMSYMRTIPLSAYQVLVMNALDDEQRKAVAAISPKQHPNPRDMPSLMQVLQEKSKGVEVTPTLPVTGPQTLIFPQIISALTNLNEEDKLNLTPRHAAEILYAFQKLNESMKKMSGSVTKILKVLTEPQMEVVKKNVGPEAVDAPPEEALRAMGVSLPTVKTPGRPGIGLPVGPGRAPGPMGGSAVGGPPHPLPDIWGSGAPEAIKTSKHASGAGEATESDDD